MNSIILTTLKSSFPSLEDSELESLFTKSEQIQCRADTCITGPNDNDFSLYICLTGIIKVNYESEPGEELSIVYLRKGEIFGELSAIDGQSRSAFCIAKTDCSLLKISQRLVQSLLETNLNFNKAVMKVLIKRIRDTDHKLFCIGKQSASEIIVNELIKLADLSTENKDRGEVPFIPKHRELALLAIVSREHTTRTMNQLQNSNLIFKEEQKLIIPSVLKLKEFMQKTQ